MNYIDSRCFIDTNIFVYALNPIDRPKTAIARKLLRELANNGNGVVSPQALLETFNVMVNKLKLDRAKARQVTSKLSRYELVFADNATLRSTLDLAVLNSISIWDAHIVASAIQSRAKYLLSEDLQAGQDFHGVEVVNPFRP